MSDVFARVGGLKSSHAFKAPVKVATTGNIDLQGEQTVDGISVVEVNASNRPDRVLVKSQADAIQNGIYRVSTGLWQRDVDFDGSDDIVKGTRVYVHSGSTGIGEYVVTADDPIIIDTSEITFELASFNQSVSFDKVGIGGAAADATNRLSVNSPAVLFNREVDDVQVKVNKAATNDTASYLFQKDFSTRAEVGLVGDDDFQFKVSPDGSNFFTGVRIDKDDGAVTFPSGAYVTATGSTTPRTLASRFAQEFHVADYGAVGDGSTDDTTAIQNTIDAAKAAGGGLVQFDCKAYSITGLTVNQSGIILKGVATGRMFSASANQTGTILKARSGASIMLTVGSNSTDSSTIAACGIHDLVIDGNGIAARSLFIRPVTNSTFRNLVLLGSTSTQMETTCFDTGLGLFTGLDYVYQCAFENVFVNAGTGSAKGIVLSGEPAGAGGNRTVFCMFRQIHITHGDGTALEINDADDNSFFNVAVSRNSGGTGIGIDLVGDDADAEDLVHGNMFFFAHAGPGGWRAKGAKCLNNWVFGLATEDGVPVNISSGAKLHYFKDDGFSNATWHVLANSAVAATHTGNTSETPLATVTIPAGAVGPNGIIRVTTLWSIVNTTGNNKTLRVRLGGSGGTSFLNTNITANTSYSDQRIISNRNSQAIQVGSHINSPAGGFGNGSAVTTATINTANATDIYISAQLANATDSVTLESYIVEILQRE